ncbi:hypothetical protein H4S08_000206 [Coemansia sp. RSA 1365]|nr:hypothetical protein H4S08_000206 [Coemansia sp. RSA 1365]
MLRRVAATGTAVAASATRSQVSWIGSSRHILAGAGLRRATMHMSTARQISGSGRKATGSRWDSGGWVFAVAVVGGVATVAEARRTLVVYSEAGKQVEPGARLDILRAQTALTTQAIGGTAAEARGQSFAAMVRLLVEERWLFAAAAAAAVAAALTGLLVPLATAELIGALARQTVGAVGLVQLQGPMQRVLALLAANGVLTYAQAAVSAALGERVGERLQKRALGALLRHELGLLDAAQPGALVTRTRADIGEVQAAARALAQGLRATATVAGVAWRLVRLSPALALTLGAAAAAAYAGLAAYGRELRVQQRGVREWEAVSAAVAAEAVAHVAALRALGAEDAELGLCAAARTEQAARARRFGAHVGMFRALSAFAGGAAVLATVQRGARLVATGVMGADDLVAFVLAAQAAQSALDTLGRLAAQMARAQAALGRVAAVASLAPADGVGGRRLKHVDGHVRFMDVDFRYPTRPGAVLHGFSLDVPAGQVVALCGPSGVGKSTVALLLQRLYEPTRGEIWLDACPLALLDAAWLRRQIAAVPQDPALFSTTILENLRMANPAADDAAVVQACRDANAHAFIERLPAGYHTVVGPRGALLSGGQRQRLGIARALLRDPRILILDEATSALDPDCERDVVAALERLMRGRTVLVIAHRLATIRRADHIVVMGRVPGHIVEQGTHDTLIARRGAYARLYREMEQDVEGSVE